MSITKIEMFTISFNTSEMRRHNFHPNIELCCVGYVQESVLERFLLLWECVVSEPGLQSLIIEYDALLLTAAALFLPQRRLSASFVGNGTNVDSKLFGLNCECVCVHLHLIHIYGF